MNSINEITALMLENAAMNSEDPVSGYHWDKIHDLILQQDEFIILLFLDSLDDQVMENSAFVGVLGSFLGYFVGHFQSKKILEAVDSLPKRFAHIKHIEWLRFDVERAKNTMDTEEEILFENKIKELLALNESELTQVIEHINDERILVTLFGELVNVAERLKSLRLIEIVESNLYKVKNAFDISWIHMSIKDAKDVLAASTES